MTARHTTRAALLVGVLTAMAVVVPVRGMAQVSLATVVDLAERNSTAVRLAEADVQKASAALAQSKDAYVPSLNFGSGLPAFPAVGFTGGVPSILNGTVQSLVFSLPQNQYIRAARAGIEAAKLSLKDAREQVALDVSTAYLELDTVNRELENAHQQESFTGRLVQVEQERTEAGVDPLNELLEVRLTAAQIRLKRIHLETRAGTLSEQIAVLTGLPVGSITPDHASIPEIPAVKADDGSRTLPGIESAQMLAVSKQKVARGDLMNRFFPQVSFNALYSRSTTILNDFNLYYAKNIPTDNFSSGFGVQIPIFDLGRGAKARESAAEALRAKVEAEQAERQNEIQIAELTGSLRELDTLAEIASLKRQIADEQLKSVLAELELGNGTGSGPGSTPQLTPKAEQLARIEESQKLQDSLDAGFELERARLNLLRALGHMEDWLGELRGK
jgi:outer membrane protein TolC